MIISDLMLEVVGKTASVKAFCPLLLRFFVLVLLISVPNKTKRDMWPKYFMIIIMRILDATKKNWNSPRGVWISEFPELSS